MTPILALILSAAFSYCFTVPTIWLATKLKLVTDSKKRSHPAHTHRGIIPRAGGVPIFLAFVCSAFIFLDFEKIIIGIILASFIHVLIGLYDDYIDSSPYSRFIGNFLVAGVVVAAGLGIPYLTNPFGGVIHFDTWVWSFNLLGPHSVLVIGDMLAIIWLVWTTNMVNWSKGVDGQLPGFVAIACIFLGLLSQRFIAHDVSAQTVMTLSFIFAGAYLGFLPFNFYPQKIMPGYGGGGLAGLWLGILAILSFGKIGTAILILAIPTTDAVYSILRRLKNKQSPFKADWGHFHHRLLEIGWGRRRIAVFYWTVSAILGFASLFLKGIEKVIAFATVSVVLLAFILILDKVKRDA